jgi:hypothetical protein
MARGHTRWNRDEYPPEWEQISYNFRASKNFTCEWEGCDIQQGDILVSRAGKPYMATVDAAHALPFEKSNPDAELYCFCKRHHRVYDNLWTEELAELDHQIRMHRILLERNGYGPFEDE